MKRLLISALVVAALSAVAWADPPVRVGRLSYLDGSVSFSPAAGEKWQTATLNYPLTTGNLLSTAAGSRAEVQIGSARVLLAPDTGVSFEAIDDQTAQVRLDKGRISVRLRRLTGSQSFEIDTQTASISLAAPGKYTINQAESGDATVVTREGDAEVTGGQAAFHVQPGEAADIPPSGPDAHQISSAPPPDQWEQWVTQRDGGGGNSVSTRYVSGEVDGADDLDAYGNWTVVAGYGPVWFPAVAIGWAPYTFGHWVWIDPWGWTWVDEEPWGFAPFHYGRWVFATGAWCWVPGPIVARPVFAPALVRWVGGTPWRGHPPGQAISWAPLGPRQVYHPWYRVSSSYFRAVNGVPMARPGIAMRSPYVQAPYTRAPYPGAPYGTPRPSVAGHAPWVPGGPGRTFLDPRPGHFGPVGRPGVAGYPGGYPGQAGQVGQSERPRPPRQQGDGQDVPWPPSSPNRAGR